MDFSLGSIIGSVLVCLIAISVIICLCAVLASREKDLFRDGEAPDDDEWRNWRP